MNGGLSESGENGGSHKLDFDASLLLCERHAACQAAQRSVGEIQERLAGLVLKHSRAQGGPLEPGDKQESSPSEEAPERRESADAERR